MVPLDTQEMDFFKNHGRGDGLEGIVRQQVIKVALKRSLQAVMGEGGFDEVLGEEAEFHETTRWIRERIRLRKAAEVGKLAKMWSQELEVT